MVCSYRSLPLGRAVVMSYSFAMLLQHALDSYCRRLWPGEHCILLAIGGMPDTLIPAFRSLPRIQPSMASDHHSCSFVLISELKFYSCYRLATYWLASFSCSRSQGRRPPHQLSLQCYLLWACHGSPPLVESIHAALLTKACWSGNPNTIYSIPQQLHIFYYGLRSIIRGQIWISKTLQTWTILTSSFTLPLYLGICMLV